VGCLDLGEGVHIYYKSRGWGWDIIGIGWNGLIDSEIP
jgi:hypothetical protein